MNQINLLNKQLTGKFFGGRVLGVESLREEKRTHPPPLPPVNQALYICVVCVFLESFHSP